MTQTAPDNALGRIAAGDAPVLETLLEMNLDAAERSGLDAETYLLVRLSALVAMGAAPVSYLITLGAAADSGLTVEKMQAVLVAIAPVVGSARVTAAAGAIVRGVLGAEALAERTCRTSGPRSSRPSGGADQAAPSGVALDQSSSRIHGSRCGLPGRYGGLPCLQRRITDPSRNSPIVVRTGRRYGLMPGTRRARRPRKLP